MTNQDHIELLRAEAERQQRRAKNTSIGLNIILSFIAAPLIGLLVLLGYWLVEPDPLIVVNTGKKTSYTHCTSDDKMAFTFKRKVVSTKDITVSVQERYMNLDPASEYYNIERIPEPTNIIEYAVKGGETKEYIFEDKTVSREMSLQLLEGESYLYLPYATYQVNPIKTINRVLPTQKVIIGCETF